MVALATNFHLRLPHDVVFTSYGYAEHALPMASDWGFPIPLTKPAGTTMKRAPYCRNFDIIPSRGNRLLLLVALLCIVTAPNSMLGAAPEIRGLTEPYRTIDVAATESGVIAELRVHEGQEVTKGEVLATLDHKLHLAMLAIARQAMEARGRLKAAHAELQLKEDRDKNFAAVFANGHARPEEVKRVQTDLDIARANLLATEEDLALKRLEYDKINAQIERRKVRAPIDGIVSLMHKDEGEFVASNDPSVLTLVRLDPLLAVFSLTTQQVSSLHSDQAVSIHVSDSKHPTTGTVEFISPVADAESGKLLVRIRVDNAKREHRSGTRCTLELPNANQARASSPTTSLTAHRGKQQ